MRNFICRNLFAMLLATTSVVHADPLQDRQKATRMLNAGIGLYAVGTAAFVVGTILTIVYFKKARCDLFEERTGCPTPDGVAGGNLLWVGAVVSLTGVALWAVGQGRLNVLPTKQGVRLTGAAVTPLSVANRISGGALNLRFSF